MRLKRRIKERKIKHLLSDDPDDSDEMDNWGDINREIDEAEYRQVKRERRDLKSEIRKFVKNFEKKYERLPTEAETGPISGEIEEYNRLTAKFLDWKLTLIRQLKLSFDAYEFTSKEDAETAKTEGIQLQRRATLSGRKAFLSTLAVDNVDADESQMMELIYH